MKKIKSNNGITLIALIVTILVMLILISAAIATVKSDGIVGHAKNEAGKVENKNEATNAFIDEQLDYLNHEWRGEIIKEPTCTEDGEKKYTCIIHREVKTGIIEKLEHDWKNIGNQTATCIQEGKAEYECTRCGAKKTDTTSTNPNNHVGPFTTTKTATCKEEGQKRCEACSAVLTTPKDPNNHTGGWTTTKKATCAATGTQRCNGCGKTQSILKDSSNHTGGWTVTKTANCVTSGTRKCNGCGATKTYTDSSNHWNEGVTANFKDRNTYNFSHYREIYCDGCKSTVRWEWEYCYFGTDCGHHKENHCECGLLPDGSLCEYCT